MARNIEVKFHLKAKDDKGLSLIYLQFLYNNQRLYFSFGEKIRPENWNFKKYRAKNVQAVTIDGQHSLNDLLNNLEKVCMDAYKSEKAKGIPTPETLKLHLKKFLNHNIDDSTDTESHFFNLVSRFISGEIKNKGKEKSKNTLASYKTTCNHLKAYEKKTNTKLTFDNINLDFFYKYVSFLNGREGMNGGKLKTNTISKNIRNIKVFMAEAVDLGYTANMQFKHRKFSISPVETDAVYLSDDEIISLYYHDFSGRKRLEQVRDLFIFGCFVGLRYSDYSTVKPENIITIDNEYFIRINTQKTKELVIIPCNPIILEIFKKYQNNPNKLPKSFQTPKFNIAIKEVCIMAGLTEVGRLSSEPKKLLYECVSSHTARRSFATNLYLEGYPTIEIMKITGHKTESSFMKYIKVSKLEAAKRLNTHMKNKWDERRAIAGKSLLKVV